MSDFSPTLIVPGLHGSGADHWQTWWQQKDRNALRVEQDDWREPNLDRWMKNLRHAMDQSPGDVWIVAHSFGCLASILLAQQRPDKIKGMLLVAPASPEKFSVAERMPPHILPIATVLVASRSDPWLPFAEAQRLAESLGSQFVDAGDAGHINAESGFGAWQAGFNLFGELVRKVSLSELRGGIKLPAKRPPILRVGYATLSN
jgi:predicted alpha/beta hydrolase family esterase